MHEMMRETKPREDREYAAEAADFAETEGEGIGQMGNNQPRYRPNDRR